MVRIPRRSGSLIGRLRRVGRRWATGAVALFAVVWLNMALQPCLMAAEPLLPEQHQDGGCPHCPPASERHCGEVDETRCAYVDGFDFDGRQPADSSAGLDVAHVCMTVGLAVDLPSGPPSGAGFYDVGPPPTGPPLFVRNCSFLN